MAGVPVGPDKLRQARELRDRGVALTTIAAMIGVPRSTIGGHLRGYGEVVYELHCEHCEKTMVAFRADKKWCSSSCATAAWREQYKLQQRETPQTG